MTVEQAKNLRFAVLAADTVALSIINGSLSVLVVPVTTPEFKGKEGLPGGLISVTETAAQAAQRILFAKGGIDNVYSEQLATFSAIDRDPRGRVVSVAYMALVPPSVTISTGTKARFIPISKVPKLAYDHNEIIAVAIERLKARITYTNIAKFLLPDTFTLTQLQKLYETILNTTLDKRNFRKKILSVDVVTSTKKYTTGEASRPAELYRFRQAKVQTIELI